MGDFARTQSGSGKLSDEFSGQIALQLDGGYRFARRYVLGGSGTVSYRGWEFASV